MKPFRKKGINYVIATYPGKTCVTNRNLFVNSHTHSVHPKDYLKFHLEQLLAIKFTHGFQITIMKAMPAKNVECWEGYYNIKRIVSKLKRKMIHVECVNVPNYGLSYGQYIRAYKKYCNPNGHPGYPNGHPGFPNHPVFDYYILVEDDYVPCVDHFDEKLIEIYNTKFYTKLNHFSNEGVLCAWASFSKNNQLHMAHSLCIVSTKTMKKVFFKQFKQQLEKLKNKCQLNFSQMFTDANIDIQDYSKKYYTPYWNGRHLVDCSVGSPENSTALFIPLQCMPSTEPGEIEFDFSSVPKHTFLKTI
jgi:hypothetical protein